MHPIQAFIFHPVKVTVGVLLVSMFGLIALTRMPMQLTPEVQTPTVSISTRWTGASPQEIESEIVQPQEEMLQSVEGLVKMSSECSDSRGSITMEFRVGTNMDEAILKVNSQLQQVREFPIDASEPVIRSSSSSDNAIAWFILSVRPVGIEKFRQFQQQFPELHAELQSVIDAENPGLAMLRIRRLAQQHPQLQPLLPPDIDVPTLRKFAEDNIETRFERVPGVANSNVLGGRDPEVQIVIDPKQLAARGLTINDVRQVLRSQNVDTSAGDIWEGKRRYVVRTLGKFTTLAQIQDVVLATPNGEPVHVRDVANVRMGFKKPDGFVRRFGTSNIAINVQREIGANVLDVMQGLREVNQLLNDGILKDHELMLMQVYDETDYIDSAVGLVNQNIILGSALTVIVLMLFLHLGGRTLLFAPLLAGSALAAVLLSPWFFIITLALILMAGFWFARGALVVALAIPISIVGTFLILGQLGRSLNVISLSGLAFAVGMLVDNAVVVLENIYRYYQQGYRPAEAALRATKEVWGAVLASTLTTLAVFVPIFFLEGEAGQLFVDIALAISSAVGLSLVVSVIVIPTASSRILSSRSADHLRPSDNPIAAAVRHAGQSFAGMIVGINHWIQQGWTRRIVVVLVLVASAVGLTYLARPKVEYLPTGNRNLVIAFIIPPPGYNLQQLLDIGQTVEDQLKPYWDFQPGTPEYEQMDYPAIGDFFYVARGRSVFLGLSAEEPARAAKLVDLIQAKLQGKFPGAFVVSRQTSLFGRGLSTGRSIDVEITGPQIEKLVGLGGRILGESMAKLPEGTQARPLPSLDLSSPELHVVPKSIPASQLGISSEELGYAVNAIVDGAYVADFHRGDDKIDLVILGADEHTRRTQDLESQYLATEQMRQPVRLNSIADVRLGSGPEQINRRERRRAITIEVTPPSNYPLEQAVAVIESEIVAPLRQQGALGIDYQITLSGTADKLRETWQALRWNVVLAVLITYLLMAALFESWLYPLVIIFSVPLGAVGGILGLKMLGGYLQLKGGVPQALDVLTMLGFVILIGTAVNNAILIVHQSLQLMTHKGLSPRDALLESIRTRVRPIFMTTTTTVFGLSPLVFFPGAGSELYRGLGSVVLGGLVVSTIFTLFLVPTLFSLTLDLQDRLRQLFFHYRSETTDTSVARARDLPAPPVAQTETGHSREPDHQPVEEPSNQANGTPDPTRSSEPLRAETSSSDDSDSDEYLLLPDEPPTGQDNGPPSGQASSERPPDSPRLRPR